jgi:hypothetical protein
MSDPKIIKNGRMRIFESTRPAPPPIDRSQHISTAVREALPKLGPDKAGRVRSVADRK